MGAAERINKMVKENNWKIYREREDAEFRKEMSESPNSDPPVIMILSNAVALSPSLKKHETAKHIKHLIEKSEVNFDDINIAEALVYLKLNEPGPMKPPLWKIPK